MDIRQTKQWANYLSKINWQIEKIGANFVFINKVPLLPFSVIKIQHPKNNIDLKKVDMVAKKYQAICSVLEPDFKSFDKNYYKKSGYFDSSLFLTHTATIQIDLKQSAKKLFASFSENARRNIKKAQKNNLVIKKVWSKNGSYQKEFEKFYELFVNLTKMKKFWIPAIDEYLKKIKSFEKDSILFFAFKKNSNQPIAAVWLAVVGDLAVYMNTGVTEEGYKNLANYLIVWECFKLAKKMGAKIFDFEGMYDPRFPHQKKSWANFSQFKKRFHGELIEYPRPMIKCYNIFFKVLFLCSKILSRP